MLYERGVTAKRQGATYNFQVNGKGRNYNFQGVSERRGPLELAIMPLAFHWKLEVRPLLFPPFG